MQRIRCFQRFYLPLFVLLGNLWIWKIIDLNPFIGISLIATSVFLFLSNVTEGKQTKLIGTVLFCFLLVLQVRETKRKPLFYLDNDEQRIQSMRLKEYPPIKISSMGKTIWIPLAHWLEERDESVGFYRILNNFSENVDPNLYFFANHPREKVGVNEFEKFPYFYLPFFLWGLYLFGRKKKKFELFLFGLLPLLVFGFIGNQCDLGPFLIFPLIFLSISEGLLNIGNKLRKMSKMKKNILLLGFLMTAFLIFIQVISYESF